MSAGTLWTLPGGHRALEVDGSTRDVLRVAVLHPHWPYAGPPIEYARSLCERAPMRYYGGAPEPEEGRGVPA